MFTEVINMTRQERETKRNKRIEIAFKSIIFSLCVLLAYMIGYTNGQSATYKKINDEIKAPQMYEKGMKMYG
ncbi:hypothetical protein [Bacillus phage vB_BanS-Thrax3]|nr:hypothetical protein [Bacillus phage vB_BanS-Thrax3]